MRKLIKNARIHTPEHRPGTLQGNGVAGGVLCGREMGRISVYDPGAMIINNGLVELIGPQHEVLEALPPVTTTVDITIDAQGNCLIPGFVDPHTHLCFAATREQEFRMRLTGSDYMEIHKRGGGIMSSVRSLRAASREELLEKTLSGLIRSLSFGVTTLEVKSGYGLSTEAELLQLQVIKDASETLPQDIVPTFLGAHSIPAEFKEDRDEYVRIIIDEMLPASAETGIPRFCDVFTEEGAFTVAESEKILLAARELGMDLKAHVDEIVNLGGAEMAARLKCISAEHLLAADNKGLEAMRAAGTIAILLPGTSFSLRKPFARAREMIDMGLPVALGTDCNPGSCFTESMPFIYTLAVMQMGMSIEEALTAVTLNAAFAIGAADRTGSLEPGKQADFVILDGESPAVIPYRPGVNPVLAVYKFGEKVA